MMLDEEIKQAHDENARRVRRLGLILLVTLTTLMIILLGVQWSSNSTPASKQLESIIEQAAVAEDTDARENNKQREAFQHDLVILENQLAGFTRVSGLVDWKPARYQQLLEIKQQALESFSISNYTLALEQLHSSSSKAKLLLEDWQLDFETKLASAKQFFDKGDQARSELNVHLALKIKPDNKKALTLQKRLKLLPSINQLLTKYRIASVEQNNQRRAQLLRKILALDPARTELLKQLKKIEKTIKETKFTDAIGRGLAEVESGQLNLAKHEFKQARDIYAERHELTVLANSIKKSHDEKARKYFLATIKQLIAEDEWQRLGQFIKDSAGRFDTIPQTQTAKNMADKMITLEQDIDRFLKRPERLEDAKINGFARMLINKNQQGGYPSSRINSKLSKLEQLLKFYATTVVVTVRSDNKTDIHIVGQNKIGKTKSIQLKLKPGRYIFEGERRGYRSHRVTLLIEPNSSPQEVTVICNEKI